MVENEFSLEQGIAKYEKETNKSYGKEKSKRSYFYRGCAYINSAMPEPLNIEEERETFNYIEDEKERLYDKILQFSNIYEIIKETTTFPKSKEKENILDNLIDRESIINYLLKEEKIDEKIYTILKLDLKGNYNGNYKSLFEEILSKESITKHLRKKYDRNKLIKFISNLNLSEEENNSLKEINEINKKINFYENKLVRHNLRFVVYVMHKYFDRSYLNEDTFEEGVVGLKRAIEKFDLSKENKLITYSEPWIRQAVGRHLFNNSRTVRVPVHIYELYHKVNKVKEEIESKKVDGQKATLEEIAEKLNKSEEKIIKCINSFIPNLSSDYSFTNNEHEDTGTLKQIIHDEKTLTAEQESNQKQSYKILKDAISNCKLDEREKIILKYRFGLDGADKLKLNDVGKMLNLSRERVRQLEKKIIKKLRKNKLMKELIESRW